MANKIIISGGGTGGHIFPAIAIANALKYIDPLTEILFVGAEGRMEMEKVPAAGYEIIGLDIQGIDRSSWVKNLRLPYKLWSSIRKSKTIIRDFKPNAIVGVGGYASGPLLLAARSMGIPYLIQEQNSYAGLTNKRLGGQAKTICVAFEGMEKFFPQEKLVITGNPIRKSVIDLEGKRADGLKFFNFNADDEKKCILVTGGSLGARTLNDSMLDHIDLLTEAGVNVIWQCGAFYYEKLKAQIDKARHPSIRLLPFLQHMDLAYATADLVISRAGAGTIAELCAVGKPVILVPSPNVAEDHQSKNAHALSQKNAAVTIKDVDARNSLIPAALDLLEDTEKCHALAQNILTMAKVDADMVIAQEVIKIAEGQ